MIHSCGGNLDETILFCPHALWQKPDASGIVIDFDAVYIDLIAPATDAAGLRPVRADEEMTGGIGTNARIAANLMAGQYFVPVPHYNRECGMGNYSVNVRKM